MIKENKHRGDNPDHTTEQHATPPPLDSIDQLADQHHHSMGLGLPRTERQSAKQTTTSLASTHTHTRTHTRTHQVGALQGGV
jgi:hypothetical protein